MKPFDPATHARPLSRRHFLAALSVPLLAVRVSAGRTTREASTFRSVRPWACFRRVTTPRILPTSWTGDSVSSALNLNGRRVFLKPNMVEYEPGTAINTHPHVVAGAAIACRRAGASDVIIGEGPGHRRDIDTSCPRPVLRDQLRENRIRFVDLNHDDVRMVPLRSWFTGLRELALPVELLQSDFIISMPKLKTHHWAGMTCSMKNLFGTVPGAVYGWPKNVSAHAWDSQLHRRSRVDDSAALHHRGRCDRDGRGRPDHGSGACTWASSRWDPIWLRWMPRAPA